jgi:hypothetical protein
MILEGYPFWATIYSIFLSLTENQEQQMTLWQVISSIEIF